MHAIEIRNRLKRGWLIAFNEVLRNGPPVISIKRGRNECEAAAVDAPRAALRRKQFDSLLRQGLIEKFCQGFYTTWYRWKKP